MKKLLLPLFLLICILGKAQNGFTTYSCTLTGSALSYNNRSCITMDNTNNIWIGFNNASLVKLVKFNGTTWTDYSASAPAGITALAADASGNLWIGTASAGISKYDGTTFTAYNQGNSTIIGNNIRGIAVINNLVYIGTTAGFSEFDGTNFVNYSTSNSGLTSNTIYCFEKENAQIWIGTDHGLHSFNGAAVAYTGDTVRINDIMVDGNATKWLGTETTGIHTYDNATFSAFSIPLVIGGGIPNKIRGIGTSINNNPIINTQELAAGGGTFVKNGLLEILPGGNYHFFAHHAFVPYECVFVSDASGALWYTDARPVAGTGGSAFGKRCLQRFQQSLYDPAAEISTIIPENVQFLDINNVNAACNPNADIHSDNTKGLYEVPKASGIKTTLGSAFWMGGYVNGQLRTAANTYRQTGVDFWPGPINTNTGFTDTATAQQFNRVWKINRYDIENFKYNFLIGNVQNGTFPIPNEILTWPGNGYTWNEQLAPYFDYNNNSYYDPQNGDYPLIKGDQMLWWVFNDALAPHTETGSLDKMNVQVQASAYAYTCPSINDSDKVINYTTFYNYRIINKSTDVIDSIYVGMSSDVDLGNYNDDYLGCNVENNFAFVYNGDSDDDAIPPAVGYGTNTPYFSYNVLKGPWADANDGLDNDHDGCIDCTFNLDANGNPLLTYQDDDFFPEPTSMTVFLPYNNDGNAKTGNPTPTGNGIQYYRYLSGIWKDGIPMSYDNGNGTTSGFYGCSYLYPGDSDPIGYGLGGSPVNPVPPGLHPAWTEENSTTNNQPADRKFVSSSGKFTLPAGWYTEYDFAYVFTQDATALANGTLYDKVVSDNRKIKKWFKNNNAPSCLDLNGIGLKDIGQKVQMLVFPNPASSSLTIDAGNSNTILKLKVYDILGKQVSSQENIRSSQSQLNITSLNAGVYLLEVQSEQGAYFTKFVKQ